MASTSTQFATSRRMGIYDPLQQISMWEEAFEASLSPNTNPNMVISQVLQLILSYYYVSLCMHIDCYSFMCIHM